MNITLEIGGNLMTVLFFAAIAFGVMHGFRSVFWANQSEEEYHDARNDYID